MVLFGALTARRRAEKVPDAFGPLLIALALAGASTLGLVVALGIFDPTAALPGPGRRDGDRQRDDRLGGRAEPARRRDARRAARGSRRRWRSAPPPRSGRADRPPRPALGDDHPGRLDQDHRADLLPGDDGRDAARRRQPDRRRPPAADPPLRPARQRRDRRAWSRPALAYRNFFTPAQQLREPEGEPAPASERR